MAMTSRAANALNLAIYLLAAAALAAAINVFAQRPQFRAQIDATKTRAYSLSGQTRQLLSHLSGRWTIALIGVEQVSDRAAQRQLDEVLRRYAEHSAVINVVRVDPADPATLGDYELVLARLREVYARPIGKYDRALDGGVAAFGQIRLAAQQLAAPIRAAAARRPKDDSSAAAVLRQISMLGLLEEQCDRILKQITDARSTSDSQPIPDFEAARSILARTLTEIGLQLGELSRLLEPWSNDPGADAATKEQIDRLRQEARTAAQSAAAAADPLRQLPPIEISTVGRQLREGEVILVTGPERAAVIPSAQLLPRSNLRATPEGGVRFDQRFRGEQVISAAIRSLLVAQMPMVVFVHAEEGSMLRKRERQADVLGVATMLSSSRYVVKEWPVGEGDRPTPVPGQKAVWVIVPPVQRSGLEPSKREQQLIEATKRLIADGEPVLLSVYPSLLPKFRVDDPWVAVGEPFGLHPDTARVVVESMRTGPDRLSTERGATLQSFEADHPVARAINGQQTYFSLPVPLEWLGAAAGVTHHAVAEIAASPMRWLEEKWSADAQTLSPPAPEQRLTKAATIVAAAERNHPSQGGRQRLIVVGSGGWMLSFVADVAVSLGGSRVALAYPGNHELMQAAVAWLAGLDEMIAPGAVSQQVARLEGLDSNVVVLWRWITLGVLPLACLLIGAGVWVIRRR